MAVSMPPDPQLASYFGDPPALDSVPPGTRLPLPDEPFVDCWREWVAEAREHGAVEVLRRHLPQLAFPVRAGTSQDAEYRAATLRGLPTAGLAGATGLPLRPGRVEIALHASAAGRIPVLIARGREEFTLLVQALLRRNEPVPVPATQGAAMAAGYNNWTRLRALEDRLEVPAGASEESRAEAWARLKEQKDLYQDRFILLSDGPYSAVPAEDLGLETEAWRALSLAIRREHECCHYFTRRLFGSMRNNVHDELAADYCGIVAAAGSFRAAWFLRFLGLEDPGGIRPDGRLALYLGEPPLGAGAAQRLAALARAAAIQLERFDAERPLAGGPAALGLRIAALMSLPLADLAAPDGPARLEAAERRATARFDLSPGRPAA